MVGVDAAVLAVGGDHLERGDAARGQAVRAGQPAEPAAEGVAGHADVRGGAGQRGEPVFGRRGGDVGPDGPALDPGDAAPRVDVDAAHPRQAEQHGVVERAEGSGVVAGGLGGHAQAEGGGGADGGLHVGRRAGGDDGLGALVDREVPRGAGGVPVGVAGVVHGAVEVTGEVLQRGGGGGHRGSFECDPIYCSLQ